MSNTRTVYLLGERLLVIQSAEAFLERGWTIAGITSPNPRVQSWAADRGIAWADPDAGPNALAEAVAASEPFDVLASITYLRMIPDQVIAAARRIAINFHDSLLPTYAGLNVTSWAIADQQNQHGITWHQLSAKSDVDGPGTVGPDTGQILFQVPIAIDADETTFSLNAKCFQAATESMDRLIDHLSTDPVVTTPQNFDQRTYFGRHRRPTAAGLIDPHSGADACHAKIRSLDFGDRFENPLVMPKLWHPDGCFTIGQSTVTDVRSNRPPGEIVSNDDSGICLATSTMDLHVARIADADGRAIDVTERAARLAIGTTLTPIDSAQRDAIDQRVGIMAKAEPRWIRTLGQFSSAIDSEPALAPESSPPDWRDTSIELSNDWAVESVVGCFSLFLARVTDRSTFDLIIDEPTRSTDSSDLTESLMASWFPIRVETNLNESVENNLREVRDHWTQIRSGERFLRDLPARYPNLATTMARSGVVVRIKDSASVGDHVDTSGPAHRPPVELTVETTGPSRDSKRVTLRWDANRLAPAVSAAMPRWPMFAEACRRDSSMELGRVTMLGDDEAGIIAKHNQTAREYDHATTIDRAFAAQVQRTPDAIALVSEDRSWTYTEVARQADHVAEVLTRHQVGPGDRVGIAMSRSLEMVASLLATHRIGAAYVPLDLEFPESRIEFMINDAHLSCLLVDATSESRVPKSDVTQICLDRQPGLASNPIASEPVSSPDALAYVIYTSGSTGTPKGVMLSHRNVINFFAGMDDVVPHDRANPGTWLAVTSLSFDISVLELLWTLCRGFKVVLHDTPSRIASTQQHQAMQNKLDFGLFYFSSSAAEDQQPYRLLMEGARFADDHGFSSVWTPERHFHDFGGPYPNAAVTGAAVAAVTQHVNIRSGSVVLPLHHPARVAEEWAVVDRLSGGRVGISFASGWQPNDFLLAPQNHGRAKEVLFQNLEVVRRLWRGETVTFDGPDQRPVSIQTFPRPVTPELPVWITTAGNEATFRQAGQAGCNVLTHLLGQTPQELAAKITAYREARAEAGHQGRGEVSVMVHTFVGQDTETVKSIVRGPMMDYLRTSASLVKGFSQTWAAFKKRGDGSTAGDLNFDDLSPEDMDDLLSFSFERYFESSGLFGTTDKCMKLVRELHHAGVTEIACLIDFGVPTDLTLESLDELNVLRQTAEAAVQMQTPATSTLAELVDRHGVTHFQCTPSMAQMLVEDDDSRAAIESIDHILLGGEALPANLAKQLLAGQSKRNPSATLTNVYGPTETTVWSTATKIPHGELTSISIGRPIANTTIYVLDAAGNPVAEGDIGQLWIGGDGVAVGYWRRDELTNEKFRPDPFAASASARMYHTGDLVRWNDAGDLEFLGRGDQQVKIRGHRIELGDIENALDGQASIRQSVVIAIETPSSDKELVAFVVTDPATPIDGQPNGTSELRTALRKDLPSHMIPARILVVQEFPLTPNGKIDRKKLADQESLKSDASTPISTASGNGLAAATASGRSISSRQEHSATESKILAIWRETLQLENIGLEDNFFDLGGHSLLAVRAHRLLRDQFSTPIAITDLFRFPSIASLAAHFDAAIDSSASSPVGRPSPGGKPASSAGQTRAARRREMLNQRRSATAKPHEGVSR